jgi:hypothetical protein
MRKLILTAITILGTAIILPAKSTIGHHGKSNHDEESFIYIYRGGQFGAALSNFTIFVDDHKLCKLSNGRYLKVPVKPGTHMVSAKRGGIGVMKKETEVEVDVEQGKSNYVSCSVKSSITRVRLNMEEVLPKTGERDIKDMKPDNCQASIEE